MLRIIVAQILLLTLLSSSSYAAVESDVCGDGIEGATEGSDSYCTGTKDKDRDGYCASGEMGCSRSGIDCDDNNRQMFVGQSSNSGCSANEYKTCESSGNYSSCAALSTYTCHSGSGATIWFATTGDNSLGSGTYADPYLDYRIFSDSGEGNYRNPVAGDCYVFRGGTYSAGTWDDNGTTRMAHLSSKNGTSDDPITIRSAPGETAVFQAGGTSPTEVTTPLLEAE